VWTSAVLAATMSPELSERVISMGNRWGRTLAAGALTAGLLPGGLACDLFRSSAGGQGHRTTIPAPGDSNADDILSPVTVRPSSGPAGTRVTITGHVFSGSVAVCAGREAATGIRIGTSGRTLSAIMPPGNDAGTVRVYVESRNGTAGSGQFRYTSSSAAAALSVGCGTASPSARSSP
jgi:hypothetical protein